MEPSTVRQSLYIRCQHSPHRGIWVTLCLKAGTLWGKLSARGSHALAEKRTKWKRDESKMEEEWAK